MPIIYNAEARHVCYKPAARDYAPGTLFACQGCKTVFEVKSDPYGNYWRAKFFSKRLMKKYGL